MSIRTKITLFVLIAGLSEAILLGIIGYNSVATVSRNAAEIRRIGSAIEGARALNLSLSRPTDPLDVLVENRDLAVVRFKADMQDLEGRVQTCAATACHGYEKRPPHMAKEVMSDLRRIRENGLRILTTMKEGEPPPYSEWMHEVDGPARKMSRTTEEMSETLLTKAKEIENLSREAEKRAVLLVSFATLFCILVAVALCHPVARGITRPLEALAEQTEKIAGGDLEVRATEDGPREIALLAQSFNGMLDNLAADWDRLITLRDRLEGTIEDRVAELRRKDDELRRSGRLASVGLIAGTVAHSLNNPLTSVLLNAEALMDSLPEDAKERVIVEDIMRDVRRCRQISDEIKAMSRDAELEPAPCSVEPVIREAVHLVRFRSEPRQISVVLDIAPGLPSCRCSAPRLLQLVTNLIENAVDATSSGGIVDVRARASSGAITLEVQDHGTGIAPERRASIFKPLFTTKQDGTGLGLAISRRIAEQHEGTIEFETRTAEESPAEHGTTFRVTLPESSVDKEASYGE